jgi:hypothetical protein
MKTNVKLRWTDDRGGVEYFETLTGVVGKISEKYTLQ